MSTINQGQVLCLHNQVQNIIRYFSQSFFAEQASSKLYRLIRKINRVRQLTELTIGQYNITMHHLRRLERAGYLHMLARYAIENALLQQMLECEVVITASDYERQFLGMAELEQVRKKAESAINIKQFFTI